MPRTGRPTLWHETLAADICAEIAAGTPKSKACVFCGVSPDTLTRWTKARPAFAARLQEAQRISAERRRCADDEDFCETPRHLTVVLPVAAGDRASSADTGGEESASRHTLANPRVD